MPYKNMYLYFIAIKMIQQKRKRIYIILQLSFYYTEIAFSTKSSAARIFGYSYRISGYAIYIIIC